MALNMVLSGLEGFGALNGLLGASAARRRAEAARRKALMDMKARLDREYADTVGENARSFQGATGLAGDAQRNLGANLGAANAEAGVTNSSAVSGANALFANDQATNLAQLLQTMHAGERGLYNQNQNRVSDLEMGYANQDLGQANDNLSGSRAGLMSWLGQLTQTLQQNRGVPNANGMGNAMNGKRNSVLPNLADLQTPNFNPTVSYLPGSASFGPSGAVYNPQRLSDVNTQLYSARRNPYRNVGYNAPGRLLG